MRTKIDEYARRRVELGGGVITGGRGREEQDPQKKAATKCECAQKQRSRYTEKLADTFPNRFRNY